MKTTINFKSRTVWTGLMSIGFGVAGFIWPQMNLSQAPDLLISVGVVAVFLKS